MSKPSGNQTVTQSVDPQTKAMNQQVFNQAQQVAHQPYTQYAGPTTAGVSGQTTQAFNNLGGVAGQYGNLANMGGGLFAQNQGLGVRYAGEGEGLLGQVNGDPTYRQAGQTGAAALGGDQGAINSLMNPYQQNVIDQVKAQYGQLNDAAQMGINDQATKAGAFGGSRQGVASGVASAEIAKGLGQQIAGLQQSGYNDAMGRAGQAAGLGLQAGQLGLGVGGLGAQLQGLGLQAQGQAQGALGLQGQFAGAQGGIYGQQAQLGDLYRQTQQQQYDQNLQNFNNQRDWDLRNFNILKSGLPGTPFGSTQTQPLTSSPFGSALGGAATGGAVGGPIGAGVGFGVGLLGGLL